MSEKKRKFFSGRSVGQAVVAAASYYGVDPGELAYREIEKRHGFVRTRRKAVIAVDPEQVVKGDAAEAPAPPPQQEATPAEEPRKERRPERGRRDRSEEKQEAARPRPSRPPAREEPAESGGEDEEPDAAPTPGWWHGERVEQDEGGRGDREDRQEREGRDDREDREPGRRVDRSEGLTRRAGEDEERGERRPRRERAKRPATRREETEGRGRRSRRREEPPAPPEPEPPREPPAPRAERLERLEAGDLEDATFDALDMLLDFVDVEAEADLFVDGDRLEVELYGPDDHILLEDEGQILLAIEHLLPRMIRGLYGDAMPVRVDCADFHFEREERLRGKARKTADEVRRRGKSRTLDELDPAERRIVHLALADDPSVETESVGSGFYKRLRIVPR